MSRTPYKATGCFHAVRLLSLAITTSILLTGCAAIEPTSDTEWAPGGELVIPTDDVPASLAPCEVCEDESPEDAPDCGSTDIDADGVMDGCDSNLNDGPKGDADGDGVSNANEQCPGYDDATDNDGDGTPDGCDDDLQDGPQGDADGDGVDNTNDQCEGHDDFFESDGDGTVDGCDDDLRDGPEGDADGDGVNNANDQCQGHDDQVDQDGDGVIDGCDGNPNDGPNADADGDGVSNQHDACPGHNDGIDNDGDGVADGCDADPHDGPLGDADGDGVNNADDAFPNDPEESQDTDGDGVGDNGDLCPGEDDTIDDDGNGTPDCTQAPETFEPEGTNQPCDSLRVVTPDHTDPTGLALGWNLRVLRVAIVADPTFVAAHPSDWEALLTDLVLDANAYYEPQLGLRLEPVLVDALPPGSLDINATADELFNTLRGFMNTYHAGVERDYNALILGADYVGSVAGQVDCVTGAYHPDTAYLYSEYDAPRNRSSGLFFKDIPLKVFMHETAHLLAAHHHYTNCGEALTRFDTQDALAVCGVMINDIGLASFQFSPTNRLIMRSFVEEHDVGEAI